MRCFLGIFLVSCAAAASCPAAEPKPSPASETGPRPPASQAPAAPKFGPPVAGLRERPGPDVLAEARQMNSATHPVPAKFASAVTTPIEEFDDAAIVKTERGFTIRLPSQSPVATPAVRDGRLYVSGGFSSNDFYCFHAQTGKFLWGVRLDDDGPSAVVLDDDSIILNTESCTIFVLDARTGKLRWGHWLADPLMSVPTAAHGRVFTTYPATATSAAGDNPFADDAKTTSKATSAPPTATHALACFDKKTGETLWQRWIDGECISAPVAADNVLYVATYAGTLYEFNQRDGRILAARRLKATSAPVVAGTAVYYSRRTDGKSKGAVREAIARFDRATGLEQYLACDHRAPYLNWRVQAKSKAVSAAAGFEAANGIMGGMGGGMMGGGMSGGSAASGSGMFAVADDPQAEPTPPGNNSNAEAPTSEPPPAEPSNPPAAEPDDPFLVDASQLEPLAASQRQAAGLIGQGNVSTLQSYHGSRVLPLGDRNVSCMGDAVVCLAASSGKLLWSLPLEGDLAAEGGSLAAPPVLAGKHLLVATLVGDVLEIDPRTGKIVETYEIGSPLRFPPVVDKGWIYAATQKGELVAVNTGKPELTGWNMWFRDAAHSNVDGTQR